MTAHELTPVQEIAGMYMKRDDLYAPFGAGAVNGGKLRQCMMLIEAAQQRDPSIAGVATYCSIHSPQGPITAAAAKHYGLPCLVAYGGASKNSIATERMTRLSMSYGASVEIISGSGRHNVLKARAETIAEARHYFVVQYGINPFDDGGGYEKLGLRSVLAFKSRILAVGERGGRKIASVCAGYADGVPAGFTDEARVLVGGVRCPIVGNVGLDEMYVDITGVDAAAGDEVAFIGGQNGAEISLADYSRWTSRIPWETMVAIPRRVDRVLIR